MNKFPMILPAFLALALLVTACGNPATPPTSAPTAIPPSAMPPTNAPAAAGAMVDMVTSNPLGSILVDDKGMTLYLFTKDTPNTSSCYDKCATSWPPLLTQSSPVAGDGIDGSKLGTTTRTDGTVQVTYNGWPLYYFAKDKKAGDVTGENVGNVWFAISPAGDKVESAPVASAPTAPAAIAATATAPAAVASTTVDAGTSQALGAMLVDDKGMTLYILTKDMPGTSTCYNSCATSWPPLLTTGNPSAGQGLDASKLGTTNRTDGTIQVTYNGLPLYYYAGDAQPGDTTGEGVGSVWFVVSPAGAPVKQQGSSSYQGY